MRSIGRSLAAADVGGGTTRHVTGLVLGKKLSCGSPQSKEIKFANRGAMFDHLFKALIGCDLNSLNISTIVVSVAGPCDPLTGIVKKFSNQEQIGVNIPLGPKLSQMLSDHCRQPIKVIIINDGPAGTKAEFSLQGALGKLQPGERGMAFIIGHGVGGGLYEKTESGLIYVPGNYEPGHFPVSRQRLRALNIPPALYKKPCGCELSKGEMVCGELVTKGEALATIFGTRLNWEINDKTNKKVSAAIKAGTLSLDEHAIVMKVLFDEGQLLAEQIVNLQRHQEKQINIALIGGIGCNFGEYLVPVMQDVFAKGQIQHWGHRPTVRVGAFSPDLTNLAGCLLHGASLEESEEVAAG